MKNEKLNGKVAVVTGASKGIGASIAKHLADEGAAVIVNYASSKTDADKVVAEIINKGGKAVAVQANVAKKAEIDHLFAESKKVFMQRELPRAISANRSKRKLRWDVSGSRRTLLLSQCFSLPRIRVG